MKKIIVIMMSLVVAGCAGDWISASRMDAALSKCDKNGGTVKARVHRFGVANKVTSITAHCQDGAKFTLKRK